MKHILYAMAIIIGLVLACEAIDYMLRPQHLSRIAIDDNDNVRFVCKGGYVFAVADTGGVVQVTDGMLPLVCRNKEKE